MQSTELSNRKPPWLRVRVDQGGRFKEVREILKEHSLHTVCEESGCPNIYECFSSGTATFLILGDECSRDCRFCRVEAGDPRGLVDEDEPRHVAEAAARLGLKHTVVTSVTRDDLPDGGASVFATTVQELRRTIPTSAIELLIPDLMGNREALNVVLDSSPDVMNHNIETVPRLYSSVRPEADYKRSLRVIDGIRCWKSENGSDVRIKSGMMVGLGETESEVYSVAGDLLENGCEMVTVGQYLSPSNRHYPVQRYWTPDEFTALKDRLIKMGFGVAQVGPLVRSSYHAGTWTID